MLDNPYVTQGVLWGLLGTLIMSLIMLSATASGVAPMPEPIPLAIVNTLIPGFSGMGAAPVILAALAHFAYGGVAGAVFGWFFGESVTLLRGLGWGAFLWVIMQVLVLPVIGWGFFGLEITGIPPKIAVGTLVLHLIYGGVLGWGLAPSGETQDADRAFEG